MKGVKGVRIAEMRGCGVERCEPLMRGGEPVNSREVREAVDAEAKV